MKIYRNYENGYKEQQAKVTALAKTLINEAINARIANGQITADDFEIYALVSSCATEQLEAAQKEFADEQARDKGVSE